MNEESIYITVPEEKERLRIVRLNKHLSYQQTEKIILDRSKQKRL